MKEIIIILLGITTVFAQVSGKTKQSLAVLQLSAQGVAASQVKTLADAFRSEMKRLGKFDIMDYSAIEQQLNDQGASDITSCNQTQCAVQAGQLLGADLVGIGSVGLIDGTYSMNVRVIEVNTSRVSMDVDEYLKCKEDNLQKELIPIVAAKVSGTPVPETQVKKKPLVKVIIAGAAVVVAVPVGLLLYKLAKKDSPEPTTEIRVQWN